MHGVVREYRLDPANVDEVIRRIAEGGVPILQSIPGFGSYAINDIGDGRIITYTVYDDATGANESTRRAAVWVRDNIRSLLPNPPTVTEGDLRVRERENRPRYGVIRRYHTEPRNVDTIVTRARDEFVPIVRGLAGFASYTILDAGGGTLLTMSGFTLREGAEESVRRAASWVRENLAPLLPNPPEVLSGELRVFVGSATEKATVTGRPQRRAA